MIEHDDYGYDENCIEWRNCDRNCALSISSAKHIERLRRLAKRYKAVKVKPNLDGSVFVTLPITWIQIKPPADTKPEPEPRPQKKPKETPKETTKPKRDTSPVKRPRRRPLICPESRSNVSDDKCIVRKTKTAEKAKDGKPTAKRKKCQDNLRT